jgi:hypothetical protein
MEGSFTVARARLARFARALALAWLGISLACRSPLRASKDAGSFADAASAEDAADSGLAPAEVQAVEPGADASVGMTDLARGPATPAAFRILNRTGRDAYVDDFPTVGCRRHEPSGWQGCSFFHGCMISCAEVQSDGDCCRAFCFIPPGMLRRIPPGESLTVPWDGKTHTAVSSVCTDCPCDEETAALGDFEVSVDAYADYTCWTSPCQPDARGFLYASGAGAATKVVASFAVPYAAAEVVLVITALPAPDAGVAEDASSPDTLGAPGTFPDDR